MWPPTRQLPARANPARSSGVAALLATTHDIRGTLVDPLKTTNVQNQRCMTTWVIEKNR